MNYGTVIVFFSMTVLLITTSAIAMKQSMEPTSQTVAEKFPPIRWAILERDLGQVQRLVRSGANVDQPLFNDETPALMAAKVECWDIVLFLLGEGADPVKPDAFGDTLAMIARTSNLHPSAVEYRDLEAVRAILRERGLY